jgi:deoxycytidylate deaminase
MLISNSKNNIINKLIDYSSYNNLKYKHTAAIISNSKILFIKNNQERLCINGQYISSLHAEVNVLYHLIKNIKKNNKKINLSTRGLDLWVIRVNSNNQLVESKPCNQCIKTIKEYHIGKVYYSTEDGKINFIDVRNCDIESFLPSKFNMMNNCGHHYVKLSK